MALFNIFRTFVCEKQQTFTRGAETKLRKKEFKRICIRTLISLDSEPIDEANLRSNIIFKYLYHTDMYRLFSLSLSHI